MKRSSLKRKTPLRAKSRLKSKTTLKSKKSIKKRSKKKIKEDEIYKAAREESLKRSDWKCIICGAPASETHHFIFRSHCGGHVPENLPPLCCLHHRGKEGIHEGKITHMDIYREALETRLDIARFAEEHIREWVKHADPELVDSILEDDP